VLGLAIESVQLATYFFNMQIAQVETRRINRACAPVETSGPTSGPAAVNVENLAGNEPSILEKNNSFSGSS
jgi:hypothetical protein